MFFEEDTLKSLTNIPTKFGISLPAVELFQHPTRKAEWLSI